MSYCEKIIAIAAPADGRWWDCQCARCGQSVDLVRCEDCDGDGYLGHDCGEDTCCCLDPCDNVMCRTCNGRGSWVRCLSATTGWCQDNPLEGRESIESGTVEWFTFDQPEQKEPPNAK